MWCVCVAYLYTNLQNTTANSWAPATANTIRALQQLVSHLHSNNHGHNLHRNPREQPVCLASAHVDRVGIPVRIRVRHHHRRDRRSNRRRDERAARSSIRRDLRRDRGSLGHALRLDVRLGLCALRGSPRLDDLRVRGRARG